MSNLGFQLIYRQLNTIPDIVCERVFLPPAKELGQPAKSTRAITSFERRSPLGSFHIVAFSLSFENDYLNIMRILHAGGIPPLQRDRNERMPLIIAGGIAVFLNPEPLADIFDLFVIGEAEDVLSELMTAAGGVIGEKMWKDSLLKACFGMNGLYAPAAYDVSYRESGCIDTYTASAPFPQQVYARHIKKLSDYNGSSCILTPHTEFSNMVLTEATRGCPHSCRFCAAGHVYGRFRYRSADRIIRELDELPLPDTHRGKVGLLGSAVSDHPDIVELTRKLRKRNAAVSLSSLRADMLTDSMIQELQESGSQSYTIAPETGSERLRAAIAKNLSTENILRAVSLLASRHVQNIKLYFLIGLPTETEHDVREIIRLAKEIKHTYFLTTQSEKWLNLITVSVSPFVPKPFTPLQWAPFDQIKHLKEKIAILSQGLKKERKIKLIYDLPKWGYIQALLSRGDRRVIRLLHDALDNSGDWNAAFKTSHINPDFYVYRERAFSERLPWDHISHGIAKEHLWKEYTSACSAENNAGQ